ncbi:MAG: tyrosinase family protein [Nitrospira sp.]|nr:tyrosinase family protein [Nitrospira sp.]MBX3348960.1 tyrosinase family protein [Nitrospira sp.]
MIRYNILKNETAAKQFIDGIKLLKNPQANPWPNNPGLSLYDFFVYWHVQGMWFLTPPRQRSRTAAHTGPVFLPWHRYYLLTLEAELQRVLNDQNFRLPYWDWGTDAQLNDPQRSALWDPTLMGQFVSADWLVRVEDTPRSTGGLSKADPPRQLRRSFDPTYTMASTTVIRQMIRNQTTYDEAPYNHEGGGFRLALEYGGGLHGTVHMWVGGDTGDMSSGASPNDPVFFLHHCNIDRIWAAWQKVNATQQYVPGPDAPNDLLFHRLNDQMYRFDGQPSARPADMLDVSGLYKYDTFADLTL